MIEFPIYNAISGDLQCTALIDCDEHLPDNIKRGLAVEWAASNKKSLCGANLRMTRISSADLSSLDLAGADLSGSEISHTDLSQSILASAVLTGCTLSDVNFASAHMDKISAAHSIFGQCTFSASKANSANFANGNFDRCAFANAGMQHTNLRYSRIVRCNFRKANLSHADLRHCDLTNVTFENADLKEALLSGCVHGGTDVIDCGYNSNFHCHVFAWLRDGQIQIAWWGRSVPLAEFKSELDQYPEAGKADLLATVALIEARGVKVFPALHRAPRKPVTRAALFASMGLVDRQKRKTK